MPDSISGTEIDLRVKNNIKLKRALLEVYMLKLVHFSCKMNFSRKSIQNSFEESLKHCFTQFLVLTHYNLQMF